MISGTTSDTHAAAVSVLAAARAARRAENRAAADVLSQAVEWAALHEVTDVDEAATWRAGRGQDTGIPIAGEGAPLVSEFAVLEFATALGMSAESGRNLLAQALELAHRLPKLWKRVQAGSLAPWRARRIAEQTLSLFPEAAAFVDDQVAPFAHKIGLAQTQRTVDAAIARHMPEHAAQQRQRAAEQRYFTIEHDQVSFAGTSRVHGELDLADALDLEDAVQRGAEQLKVLGNEECLDVRRSLAVGVVARGQRALELQTDGDAASADPVSAGSTTRARRDRSVVLYVHLSEDAIRSGDPHAPAWVENAGGQLLTAGQIAAWCAREESRVSVKPVIDLNRHQTADAYAVPERIAEQVRLRDRTCVHPFCQRPARFCDLDHIVPFDPDGPPGQTSTFNLALLCRRHHRLKTHGGWTYTMIEPGVFLWHSPYGHTWLRDRTGTTDLTPPSLPPPVPPPLEPPVDPLRRTS